LRTQSPLVVLSVIAAMSCNDQEVPFAPRESPDFAKVIVIDGGGFDDSNNVSAFANAEWGPSGWFFLPGSGQARSNVDGEIEGCGDLGFCQAGDLRATWGVLGLSPFDDPNPNPGGEPSPQFAVLSNANFNAVNAAFGYVTNLESGIERPFTLPPNSPGIFLDFRIDAAFGTGQKDNGPGQNDFAVVEFLVDNATVEMLRWSRDDLQPGGQGLATARSRMDCGTSALGSVQTYPLCTGWERHFIDVSHLAGRFVTVRIRVRQALPDNDVASFLAVDNVRFEGYDAVSAQVDVAPNDPANVIDLAAANPLSVAMFGSATLNVGLIDPATFRIGQVAALVTSYSDLNNDGFDDALLQFDPSQLIAGGALTPQTTALELVGILPDRTRVRGSQPVSIAGRASIDIKPDKISLSLTGTVSVYLYSSPTFDAASASASSIRWYNNGVGAGAPVGQRSGLYMTSVRDFNGDGRADRLLTFLRSDLTAAGLNAATTSFVVADRTGSVRFEASDAVPPIIVP
jgi:hypothetical protein